MTYWALKWRSENLVDGKQEYILWHDRRPLLFDTRHEARTYREERYGYIRNRPDLKAEPHGWRVPQVVKVNVKLEIQK